MPEITWWGYYDHDLGGVCIEATYTVAGNIRFARIVLTEEDQQDKEYLQHALSEADRLIKLDRDQQLERLAIVQGHEDA